MPNSPPASERVSPESILAVLRRLHEIKEDVTEIKVLAKETNGRIRELELWRARVQGAMITTRVLWMVGGGIVTGLIIGLANARWT